MLYVEQCIWQVVQAARAVCCVCNAKRRNAPALVECEAVTARRFQSTTLIRNAGHHPGRGVRRRRRMEHKNALKAPIAEGCCWSCALCVAVALAVVQLVFCVIPRWRMTACMEQRTQDPGTRTDYVVRIFTIGKPLLHTQFTSTQLLRHTRSRSSLCCLSLLVQVKAEPPCKSLRFNVLAVVTQAGCRSSN